MFSSNKYGGQPIHRKHASRFWDVLETCNLIDLGFLGPKFTWLNNRGDGHLIMECLNRSLCNSPWIYLFLGAQVHHLTLISSDHSPLLIKACNANNSSRGPRPFYMLLAWFEREDFLQLVQQHFSSMHGNFMHVSSSFQ